MENSYEPFSVCFNLLKMKYKDYDSSLESKNILQPNDRVNVFINLETVFKNLSMVVDLEKKILIHRNFEIIMISNTLNLIAHYKRFFANNGLSPKVYIYNTDFNSTEFPQFKYNEDYRSYYLLKFNENPKFALLTEKLKNSILPKIKTLCEFIPDVYYISTKNIEGSLVPYIVANVDKSRKNLIIGGEIYDTQYSSIPGFINHYFHRGFNENSIYSDLAGYIKSFSKKDEEDDVMALINTFDKYPLYCSLISVLGDKNRSIDGIDGIGVNKLQKFIEAGMMSHIIQKETTNPEVLGEVFHDGEIKKDFVNNFYCSSILNMYDELSDAEKTSVLNQMIDRVDYNSLAVLNRTKFYDYPIILEGLFI